MSSTRMARTSLAPSFTFDMTSEELLPPRDLLPHSAPSIDQDKIAPWLSAPAKSDTEREPPTPPPKNTLFGFPHKASISSFTSSSMSTRTSRPSETFSIESNGTYGETLRPQDAKRPTFGRLTGILRKTRSRSRLRPDELRLHSSTSEPVPPLPSPDVIPYYKSSPPSPPPVPYMSKKAKGKKKASNMPPPPPPKDEMKPEFELDTDLDRMEGIIDLTVLPETQVGSSSPSSMLDSSGVSSDVSSIHYKYGSSSTIHAGSSSSTMFNNPNPFQQPSTLAAKRKIGAAFDGRRLSPKSRPPAGLEVVDIKSDGVGGSPSWTAPESWAVEKEGDDVAAGLDYSSSDESMNATSKAPQAYYRKKRSRKSYNPSRKAATQHSYRIRIHRANNSYHVVSIGSTVTVAELTPELNYKLLLDPEAEMHRLYLKERGRERVLAQTEKPAVIVKRRLEQAGYDAADGLEMLGAEDIGFLLKFVYKSNVLGPAEEELKFENFERVDLTGRSLRTVPVVLYPEAGAIVSLTLSRNPMLEIPLDFMQSCTTLRELRLSNMAMKKVPQSVRHCKTLHVLDLSSNRIADLNDAGLDSIPDLRSLKIQNNRMEDLPWYFPRLRTLVELNISNNKFCSLSENICKIGTLRDLDISFNMISQLPDQLGSLYSLEQLIMVGNQVSSFPPSCNSLTQLRMLDCRRNNISDLSAMSTLPRVEFIMADHNGMSSLDLSFGPSLKTLDASHNDITQLTLSAAPVGQPFALTNLDISHAKLSSLDELALSRLTSLRTLRICHNSIRSIPDSLGDLTELLHLSVSNNQLRTLPSTIGRLRRLEKLEAHNNSLAELPATLWECPSLSVINVTSNLLGTFHEPPVLPSSNSGSSTCDVSTVISISSRPTTGYPERKISSGSVFSRSLPPLAYSLEKLYLGENRLTEDVLHPLTLLRELKVLNLSFNDIQEMPRTFFRNLTKLEELYLSGNKLSALPTEDLHRLANLRTLFLNGNKLQTLPHELGKLKNLSVVDAGSNVLKYNINNWEFDWNWNFNPSLRYLNLSGNKRLEIKPDHKSQAGKGAPERIALADFSSLTQLKVLGLMDVTTTFVPNMPEDNEDRRVRTSLSEVNKMAYGIADTLGASLNMFDLVQPEFRDRRDEAIFAMFGRSSHIASSSRVSKYLHDHFLSVFSRELEFIHKGEGVPDAMRRSFLKLNKYLHDFLFARDPRKLSTVSANGSMHAVIDMSSVRSGASGIVLYFAGRTIFAANVGNSLAVVSRQGTAELLSKKHDPFERSETHRIRSAEGWVSPKGYVNDEIDVSRSFGFYNLLPVINAQPEVCAWELSELDEFVIIGNQGLWDYVPYQTAVDIARSERADPMIAAQKLRDFAISYGAEGTTMIMVISVADIFNQGLMRSRQPTVDSLIDPDAYVVRRRPKNEIINRDISRLEDEVSPPVGHVAIVFTDIRNSTHLWEVNAGMATAMQQHNILLRRQLRLCGGYEVKTEGDAFMCSFPTALSALWWSLTVQVQLLQQPWPLEILECEDGKELRDSQDRVVARGLSVRFGIHVGNPVCEPDPITQRMDYFGPMVNRASRISSSAAGGQIMCSADIIREINATIFGEGAPTEHSHYQPIQAIEAVRRMSPVIVPVGEVKLKGLEAPETLSLVYPKELEGRQELETVESSPGAAGSRVQFSVEQMRELALLCIRLETLTSSRVFKPLPERKGSTAKSIDEHQSENTNSVHLYGNLNVLLPTLDKASDAELMLLLDSLSLRIENALAALTLKQIVLMNKSDGGDTNLRRNGSGLDVRTLQHLLSFLQA